MANSIAKFKNYIALLDEVYKEASKTAVLDGDASLVRAGANANEIIIPKMSLDGLADYSRNSGYVRGDVTLTNETVAFNYDRGRQFVVDAMDDEETAGIAFGKLSSEFIRTKVTPEMDAFCFAELTAHAGHTEAGALANNTAIVDAVHAGMVYQDNLEVTEEGRYLFCTPAVKAALDLQDSYKSRAIIERFADIIAVPQGRFYTKIDLKTGGAGQTAGGYAKADDGLNIDFMIVEKSAVIKYPKHTVDKVFAPDEVQDIDGWKFNYRAYGLVDVYENKEDGIYVHTPTNP